MTNPTPIDIDALADLVILNLTARADMPDGKPAEARFRTLAPPRTGQRIGHVYFAGLHDKIAELEARIAALEGKDDA